MHHLPRPPPCTPALRQSVPQLLAPAAIIGYQGEVPGKADPAILATAKHFVGDGGTKGGVDRGNTELDSQALWEQHLRQYESAIQAGVGSVMVSFSSVVGDANYDPLFAYEFGLTSPARGEQSSAAAAPAPTAASPGNLPGCG